MGRNDPVPLTWQHRVVSLPAALACVVLRFRASRGVERQQLRWVAAGATAAVAGLLLSTLIALGAVPGVADVAVTTSLLCLPVAIGLAVLPYRLWDLDRLVSRTVTYTMVTGLLVLPYLLILPVATRLVEGPGVWGGRPHPGRGGRVCPVAPPGPGPGRLSLQPPPLPRRPHR